MTIQYLHNYPIKVKQQIHFLHSKFDNLTCFDLLKIIKFLMYKQSPFVYMTIHKLGFLKVPLLWICYRHYQQEVQWIIFDHLKVIRDMNLFTLCNY